VERSLPEEKNTCASNLSLMAECITFLNHSYNHFIKNLFVYLWTNYTPAFKTPSSNGKLIQNT